MARFFRIGILVLLMSAGTSIQALQGCQSCILGWDGYGKCTDPNVALASWEIKANCKGYKYCYYVPGGVYCEPRCSGTPCFFI